MGGVWWRELLDRPPPKSGTYLPPTRVASPPVTDPILDALMDEVQPASVTRLPGKAIAKMRYTHDAMVDQIIANPTISQNALAALFGYSAGWVSQVIASDAFQTRLAERSAELVDPTIRASVEEQFKGLVYRSLAILRDKLNAPSAAIPDQLALQTLSLTTRALGYGARLEQPPSQVNVSVHLESLGDNLTQLLRRKRSEVIDVPPSDK